tara:strand:- start:683 stop:1477 length:795 start_codon:yes stop_codon:yes gene_type:complete
MAHEELKREMESLLSSNRKHQKCISREFQKLYDDISKVVSSMNESIKQLNDRCTELEYHLSSMYRDNILKESGYEKLLYIEEQFLLHKKYPFAGVNFECLKLYLSMHSSKFIYGITNIISYQSYESCKIVHPSFHLENTWSDYIYMNIKLDTNCYAFNINFSFQDCNLFWGLKYKKDSITIYTTEQEYQIRSRGLYTRLLYNSITNTFTGIGTSDDFCSFTMQPSNIYCNFVKTWIFDKNSVIKICNDDFLVYSFNISGLVFTS